MTLRKVMVVAGTRPEGIKLAPLVTELRRRPDCFSTILVSTGQHREMLAQVLSVFKLKPDIDLDVMLPGQDLTDVTVRILLGMRDVLRSHHPDWVVVQGDTTTVLAASLAAFYERIRVAHVEAGLRTGDKYSPYPEEANRRLASELADLHFAPTREAEQALLQEGFSRSKIHVTGNTVVDAVLAAREIVRRNPVTIPGLDWSKLTNRRVILVTGHRRESFGRVFEGICRALLEIVRRHPDVELIYPVHLNPNVRAPVNRILGEHERINLLPPLSYLEFVSVLDRCHLVLTDSGGVQEEGPSFGKPVLVMRDKTERPEGVRAGVAKLVGTDEKKIVRAVSDLLCEQSLYLSMASKANPYGDGRACERICDLLAGES